MQLDDDVWDEGTGGFFLLLFSRLTDATLSTDDPSEWLTFLVSGASSSLFSWLIFCKRISSRNYTTDRFLLLTSPKWKTEKRKEYHCVFPRCNISRDNNCLKTNTWSHEMMTRLWHFANVIRKKKTREGQQEMIFDPQETERRSLRCVDWVKLLIPIQPKVIPLEIKWWLRCRKCVGGVCLTSLNTKGSHISVSETKCHGLLWWKDSEMRGKEIQSRIRRCNLRWKKAEGIISCVAGRSHKQNPLKLWVREKKGLGKT